MNFLMLKQQSNEKGLTLVEVLASIVILAIVLTIFLLVFSQTAKTTNTSEQTIDATYIAQTEMENIYEASQTRSIKSYVEEKGLQGPTKKDIWNVYNKSTDEGFFLQIKLAKAEYDMTRVLIQVYEKNDPTRLAAQMENVYKWGINE